MTDAANKPRAPIRRFDVFAEYSRLQGLKRGLDPAHAKGYGLWVAKVVASGGGRRTGAPSEPRAKPAAGGEHPHEPAHEPPAEREWHLLGGEPQTDERFDREIVRRMGADFYASAFAPAIAAAFAQGQR